MAAGYARNDGWDEALVAACYGVAIGFLAVLVGQFLYTLASVVAAGTSPLPVYDLVVFPAIFGIVLGPVFLFGALAGGLLGYLLGRARR